MQPARPRGPHWSLAGRPSPGSRRGAEGLLPSRSGRARLCRRRGGAGDPRLRLAPSPRSRRRPARLRRWRLRSASDSAPEGPGQQLPGARVSGRARLPGGSRAPPPAFAFASAARRGSPGQRPGPLGRPRRGNLAAGRSGIAARRRPPAPRAGWEQVARRGRALCVGARKPAWGGRASLGRSLPSPVPPGGCSPGRRGNGAGIARNVPPGTAWLQGKRAAAEVREPGGGARATPPPPDGEGCSRPGAFCSGERFIFPRRPWRGELSGRVCRKKEDGEARDFRSWFLAVQSTLLSGTRILGCGCARPQARRRCGAGDAPGPVFNKGCSSPPWREGQLRKSGLQRAGLSPGGVCFLFGLSFY